MYYKIIVGSATDIKECLLYDNYRGSYIKTMKENCHGYYNTHHYNPCAVSIVWRGRLLLEQTTVGATYHIIPTKMTFSFRQSEVSSGWGYVLFNRTQSCNSRQCSSLANSISVVNLLIFLTLSALYRVARFLINHHGIRDTFSTGGYYGKRAFYA